MTQMNAIQLALGGLQLPKETMLKLEELAFRSRTDGVDIDRTAHKMQVPEGMSYDDAIVFLERKRNEEEANYDVIDTIDVYPLDGARAMSKVIEQKFGTAINNQAEVQTMFGPIRVNATRLTVPVGHNQTEVVAWGVFVLPGIGEAITGHEFKDGRFVFQIHVTCKGKYRAAANEFVAEVKEYVSKNSIYRGKAIKLSFRDSNGKPVKPGPDVQPRFLDTTGAISPIFSLVTQNQLDVTLFNPIVHTKRLRERKIPVGRKILLEGGYGNGKTLLAAQLAQLCTKQGWTFVAVADTRDLQECLRIAAQYSPAVVFAEDIDTIMKIGTPDEIKTETQRLSTSLDGVDNKNREVMLVMTTNDVMSLPGILVRPGRMDAIIEIGRPDQAAMLRLVHQYAGNLLAPGVTDEQIVESMQTILGQSGSFIREVVDRAKLSAVQNEDGFINDVDLRVSATMMKHHAAILDRTSPEEVKAAAATQVKGNGELVGAGR